MDNEMIMRGNGMRKVLNDCQKYEIIEMIVSDY